MYLFCRAQKEKIIGDFKRVEQQQEVTLQKIDQIQNQSHSSQEESKKFESVAESLEMQFKQLSMNKSEIESAAMEYEER